MSGSESQWRRLLDLALPALDHVFGSMADESRPAPWTLGGGTALALWIDHRVGYDLAATARVRPGLPEVLARAVPDALERTLESLEHLARRGGGMLAGIVIPAAHAADLIAGAFPVGRRVPRDALGPASHG